MSQIPLETWIELLNKYLADAEQGINNNDVQARKTVREKLHAFIRSTPQKYEFLDDIVRSALHDLNAFDLNVATRNIKKTAIAIRKQRAIIALATKEAREGAAEIRLDSLIQQVDHAKKALDNMKETVEILGDDNKNFVEKVKALKGKIDDFKRMT